MPSVTDIHKEMAGAWNDRNFNKLRTLFHPEYTYTAGDGREITGGPDTGIAIAQMYATAFPDAVLEIKHVYTQGNTAVAEMVARGTHQGELMGIAPTNRPVQIDICNVMETRDGKIYREREYLDMLAIMSQLGVVRLPGAVGKTA